MSDTSFTKPVDDEDYSLDEEEEEQDTTALLLGAARKSVNLPDVANKNAPKRPAPRTVVSNAKRQRRNSGTRSSAGVAPVSSTRVAQSVATTARQIAVNFLNSDKWGKDVRPPHLEDDDVFNLLSVEAAAQHIMQWMTRPLRP